MMTPPQAIAFANGWIAAWNAHDLDRILAHYTDELEMSSPFIIQFMHEPSGRLVGKAKVRAYWQEALIRIPYLHFTLDAVHAGVNSLALHYTNQNGRRATEVFFFNEQGLVYRAAAHYLAG